MGQLGFSYIGFLFLLMLLIPNLFWIKRQSKGYLPQNEDKVLRIFERTGQLLVTCAALIFPDRNLRAWSPWTLWLVAAAASMLLYECWWIRYFKSKRTLQDFYRTFFGIPVAGATLPVLASFLLGVYGKVVCLILSAILLDVGHIGIHLQHRKSALHPLKEQNKKTSQQ
ncbi:MAG: hypothetical protein ACOYI4_09810 [Christensenellales bacterium]